MVRRAAFTLIELIFAIVIIAISVISLPMMSQTVSEGIDANIVQEAIFAAATELNEAVTAHWDENSIEPGMPDSSARVIDIGAFCSNDSNSSTFRQMTGHINQPLHRRCLDLNTTAPDDNATTTNIAVDLNDISHPLQDIFDNPGGSAAGYKDIYQSELTITRPVSFNGNSNDVKMITSTIKDSDGNTIALLRTYSANIGEVDYYKRNY